jgi:hypothetical protein
MEELVMTFVLGLGGLLFASSGVRGIVTQQLELSDESGGTTTLEGLSAVVAGSIITVVGIGTFLLTPVIVLGA